jgi:hypothetical protein
VKHRLRSSSLSIRGLLMALSGMLVLGGWTMGAPHGSSPDDSYHLASIWCAEGPVDGRCIADPSAPDRRVLVPKPLVDLTCFAGEGTRSAACAPVDLSVEADVYVASLSNVGRERPNGYYWAAGKLVGADLATSIARIRIANGALFLLMVALTAWLARPPLRRAVLLSSVVTSVPLGLFLITSVNSAAWGLAGLTTFWANAITAVSPGSPRRRAAAATLAIVGAGLGMAARTEAIAHVTVLSLAVATLSWFGIRTSRARLGTKHAVLAGALIAATAVLLAVAPQTARVDSLLRDLAQGRERLIARGLESPLLAISFEVPQLWTGALGHIWGLGALDTPVPTLATLPTIFIFLMLLILGLQQSSRSRIAAVLVVGFSLYAVPAFSLLRSGLVVWEELQPRQFMVLMYALLGLSLFTLVGERRLVLSGPNRFVIVAGLGMAHAVALLVSMRRFITGLVELRYVSPGSEITWWWASGPSPNTVWIVTSLAFVALLALVSNEFAADHDVRRTSRRSAPTSA